VVVHLDGVPRRLGKGVVRVLHLSPDGGVDVLGTAPPAKDGLGHQTALDVGQGPDAAERLKQTRSSYFGWKTFKYSGTSAPE
jgi:hypothetical protein